MEPFLKEIPLPGLYGFQDETLLSLVLAHVKMKTKDSEPVVDCITVSPGGVCILSALKSYCMQSEDEVGKCSNSNVVTCIDILYYTRTYQKFLKILLMFSQ